MKYIIDEVTKTDKYVTGHENGTVFGLRTIPSLGMYDNYHIGNDYNTPQGTPLYAPVKCEVLRKVDYNDDTGYGYALFLYMIDYNKTLHLSHLSKFADIKEGQIIDQGTLVAYSGGLKGTEGAGTSTGAHLHLGIASGKKTDTVKGNLGDGTWLDPSKFDFNDKVEKPQTKPSNKYQFNPGDVLEISGHYPTVHNGNFISTPKKHVIVKKVFPKDHYPFQVVDMNGNVLGGVDPVNVYRVVERGKPIPSEPQPSKPSFSPYNYSLAKGSTLYDSNGNAYAYPTTQSHTVKILQEKNGFGLIRESWLVGVSEAWVKLGAKPQAQPKPKPSLVGKQVTLSGKTRLFHNSTGSTTYPYNSVNQYTDLRTRKVPVVQDKGDRVEVRISGFDPELIWIDKKELR